MYYETDHLAHHGVKGMKWGVRRYQNKDGSLTEKGKKRYSENIAKKAIKGSDPIHNYSPKTLYDNKKLEKEIAGDIKNNFGKTYAKEIQAVKDSKSLVDKYEKPITKVENELDTEESWDKITDYALEDAIKMYPEGAAYIRSITGDEKITFDSAYKAFDMVDEDGRKYDQKTYISVSDFCFHVEDLGYINGMNRRLDELSAKYGADYDAWNKAKDVHRKNCENLTNAIVGKKFANKTMEEISNTPVWQKHEYNKSYRADYSLMNMFEKSYKYL